MDENKARPQRPAAQPRYWWRTASQGCDAPVARPDQACPQCGLGTLAYNPQFMLACPACGYVAATGAFT